MCINNSTLVSHFKAKQVDTKSGAPFFYVFETLQVKSTRSETVAGTHKMETFPIPRVLMVSMSRNEAVFDGLSAKEEIVNAFHFDNEDNIE